MKKLVLFLMMFGQSSPAKNISLLDANLEEKPAAKVKTVDMSIWITEQEMDQKQIEYIESIEKICSELGGTEFESADAFNLYFAALYSGLVAVGIKKPMKFSIVLENDDHIDIWRLNGFDANKFFALISAKYVLPTIEEEDEEVHDV